MYLRLYRRGQQLLNRQWAIVCKPAIRRLSCVDAGNSAPTPCPAGFYSSKVGFDDYFCPGYCPCCPAGSSSFMSCSPSPSPIPQEMTVGSVYNYSCSSVSPRFISPFASADVDVGGGTDHSNRTNGDQIHRRLFRGSSVS